MDAWSNICTSDQGISIENMKRLIKKMKTFKRQCVVTTFDILRELEKKLSRGGSPADSPLLGIDVFAYRTAVEAKHAAIALGNSYSVTLALSEEDHRECEKQKATFGLSTPNTESSQPTES